MLEVRESVRAAAVAHQALRVAAAGHSFTPVACTDGRMLRLGALDRVLDVDPDTCRATVEAGIPIWRLDEELAQRGLALPNLGDIDRQSLAGAISTGTHGTGSRYQGIASAVVGLELVTAAGEVLRCSPTEEPEVFACARVALGALGVITTVTLQCEPVFRLHSREYPMCWEEFLTGWPALVDANEHVDCYWFPHSEVCTVKASNRTDAPIRAKTGYRKWRDEIFWGNVWFGGLAWYGRRRPDRVPDLVRRVAEGIGRSERVDLSYRVFCSRRLVRFVEMEYAIPRPAMAEGLRGIRDLIERERLPVDFPVEIRALGGDDIPLSMAQGRATCFLAVHVSSGALYERYFRGVEEIMSGLGGRPHWGKVHYQSAATLAPRYPQWDRFRAVRAKLDPDGLFANPYTDRVLGLP